MTSTEEWNKIGAESTTLGQIKRAYAYAAIDMPPDYPALPAWEDLTPSLREAFITVFSAGGSCALKKRDCRQTMFANR
jgi:hypothetical protein